MQQRSDQPELVGFDGNYTLEENIRQFFHVWVEGTKRIAPCQHELIIFLPSRLRTHRWTKSGYRQTSCRRRAREGSRGIPQWLGETLSVVFDVGALRWSSNSSNIAREYLVLDGLELSKNTGNLLGKKHQIYPKNRGQTISQLFSDS